MEVGTPMGIIGYYDAIDSRRTVKLDKPIASPTGDRKIVGNPIKDESRVITLAEFDPVSKDAITAHRLRDYRRKTFNLTLLPDVHILLDEILEGSAYWNAKLHNESPYS